MRPRPRPPRCPPPVLPPLLTLLLLALPALPRRCAAFHFFVEEGKMLCFTEELSAARSVVHIAYKIGADLDGGEGVTLDVLTPKGSSVKEATLALREGSLQVTTEGTEGPHSLCLRHSLPRSIRIALDVDVQETGTGDWIEHKDPASGRTFYHNPKTKESLWDLPKQALFGSTIKETKEGAGQSQHATTVEEAQEYEQYINALHALTVQIKEDSEYIETKQRVFKQTAEMTADRVWWLSLMQVIICVALPVVQATQMKRMFVKKKLV